MASEAFWFWLLVILFFIAVFAWPTWPYTRQRGVYRRGGYWGYAPAAVAIVAAAILLLLIWIGFIAVAWPWAAVAT